MLLLVLIAGFFAVSVKMNHARFLIFDMGKFDLGNMAQMVWNTQNGRFMYVSDYFGTAMPRWGMSHVDPILALLVPIYAIFPHALTLVYIQVLLVLLSSLIIYKISMLNFESRFISFLFAMSFLFYPAVGFLNTITDFHGVTFVIPFFLLGFYIFELMHKEDRFTPGRIALMWLFFILTMMGKEQIPIYIALLGVFFLLFRFRKYPGLPEKDAFKNWFIKVLKLPNVSIGVSMLIVGTLWFVFAFLVLIPSSSHYRVEGFQEFQSALNLTEIETRNVENVNYFLHRYETFGDSYSEIVLTIVTKPALVWEVITEGTKERDLKKTFGPMLYSSLFFPPLFVILIPDLLINYMVTDGGIITTNIANHRISMLIPVIFLSSIYAVLFFSTLFARLSKKKFEFITRNHFAYGFAILICVSNVHYSFEYENLMVLWSFQAVEKKILPKIVRATSNPEIGEVVNTLSKLDSLDSTCANEVVSLIPDGASLSAPDTFGSHLHKRMNYGIFPALYHRAEYVVIDSHSRKLQDVLDIEEKIIERAIKQIITSNEYELLLTCDRFGVYKRVLGEQSSVDKPVSFSERASYTPPHDYHLYNDLSIVDFSIPHEVTTLDSVMLSFTYHREEAGNLEGHRVYMSFINSDKSEALHIVNLPSYAFGRPSSLKLNVFYEENIEIALPSYLSPGEYKVFIGITDQIRTRSVYLQDIVVK